MPLSAKPYTPIYFLASLGAGGLVVTFFMMLMFWVPHPGRPVPIFEDITAAFAAGALPLQAAIVTAVLGIAVFAFLNIKLLIWNLRSLSAFRFAPGYAGFMSSNGQSSLTAMPLALAMTVNAMFIVGLVFVPKLWTVVEFLFPLAMLAFLAIGTLALVQIGQFLTRILTTPGAFDLTAHNSFAQVLPGFALAMVGVGLAAPSAMSLSAPVVATSLALSTFFAIASLIYTAVAVTTAINAMLKHGAAPEAAPTLMIIVPLMTVLGILFLRQSHGLHTTLGSHADAGQTLMMLAQLVSVQVLFLLFGLAVLFKQNYFAKYVMGTETSPGSYALVCPGVAFSVMMMFFVNKGLVGAGVIDKFGTAYWAFTAIALAAQILTIAMVLRLNRQHFGKPVNAPAIPAE